MHIINGISAPPDVVARRLRLSAQCCPTWVQTCVFALDGEAPSAAEWQAYLALLEQVGAANLQGVLLYGLARPSLQPGAERLARLSEAEMDNLAAQIRQQGLAVKLSP